MSGALLTRSPLAPGRPEEPRSPGIPCIPGDPLPPGAPPAPVSPYTHTHTHTDTQTQTHTHTETHTHEEDKNIVSNDASVLHPMQSNGRVGCTGGRLMARGLWFVGGRVRVESSRLDYFII